MSHSVQTLIPQINGSGKSWLCLGHERIHLQCNNYSNTYIIEVCEDYIVHMKLLRKTQTFMHCILTYKYSLIFFNISSPSQTLRHVLVSRELYLTNISGAALFYPPFCAALCQINTTNLTRKADSPRSHSLAVVTLSFMSAVTFQLLFTVAKSKIKALWAIGYILFPSWLESWGFREWPEELQVCFRKQKQTHPCGCLPVESILSLRGSGSIPRHTQRNPKQ